MNSYLGSNKPRTINQTYSHSQYKVIISLLTLNALTCFLSLGWHRFHWLYNLADGWVIKALSESHKADSGTL